MRAKLAVWMIVGLGFAAPGLAAAAPDDAQRKNDARKLADRAYELYSAGDYPGAIDAFKRADAIFHAPTLLYGLAKAHAKAGHLRVARDLFRQVIAERLPEGAPEEFLGAQRSAAEEIKPLLAAIASVDLRVHGAPLEVGASIQVDDAPAEGAVPLELDPGRHVIVVTRGTVRVSREVVLADGAREVVDLELPSGEVRPSIVPAAVAFGVGGAGLVVGLVAGVVTLKRASTIKSACPHGVCPTSEKSAVSSANGVAAASTVGFVTAGVGAIVGTVLFVRRAKTSPATVSADVGPGSFTLRGTF
jgi:hypothetical protein